MQNLLRRRTAAVPRVCVLDGGGDAEDENLGEALRGHDDGRVDEPQTGQQTRDRPHPDGSVPQTARQKHLLDWPARPKPQMEVRVRAGWSRHEGQYAAVLPVSCSWLASPGTAAC